MNTEANKLSQSVIDEVTNQLDSEGPSESILSQFRENYQGIHFTYCMDDDISVNAKALVSRPLYNLYLVNSSDHCSVLSNDIEAASGVVIAEVIPE